VSVLSNLLRRLVRRRGATRSPGVASPSPRPTTKDYRALAPAIEKLCAEGKIKAAFSLFARAKLRPNTTDEALQAMHDVAVPMLAACERGGEFAVACELESAAYLACVREFELPSHYEACIGMTDPILHRMGQARRPEAPASRVAGGARLLFFVQSLSSAGAHIPLLCDILEAYLEQHPDQAGAIGFGGQLYSDYAPRLLSLAKAHSVGLHGQPGAKGMHASLEACAALVESGRYDRIIVVAMPLGISYLSGRLRRAELAWFSVKFELDCFEHLEHRVSVISSQRDASDARARKWLQAPPFIARAVTLAASDNPSATVAAAREQHTTLYYTVNREQKIRNPDFLRAVADILDRVPEAGFVWTGENRPAEIDDYFANRGLLGRTHFAGWIHPDDLVLAGDIFLDTPLLSGTVAARAAVNGRPVVTFARSQSWINMFGQVHALDERRGIAPPDLLAPLARSDAGGLPFEFGDHDAYVGTAVRLASDLRFRIDYAAALGRFTNHYYFDKARWAEQHVANLRDGLSMADELTQFGA
jgi:hypothetical protein